jgi:hypothetical protein
MWRGQNEHQVSLIPTVTVADYADPLPAALRRHFDRN